MAASLPSSSFSSASTAASTNSSYIIPVPLEWVDRQAYVATLPLDGVKTRLQIGTMYPYAWVACGLVSLAQCQVGRCDVPVYAETNRHCATQRSASLDLRVSSSGPLLTTPSLPLRIIQYHNLTELNDTRVYTPPATKPDYSSEQPRLVPGAQGVFGLGRGSLPSFLTIPELVRSFSLYVTNKPNDSRLLLDVGPDNEPMESFKPNFVIANGWTASYAIPVRNASRDDEDSQALAADRWDLSLVGVRFDEDQPLYPRVYSWSDEPGDDAAASLSLNDAVLGMPSEMLDVFRTKYLSSCSFGGRNTVGNRYFMCAASLQASLPRITLYLGGHSFFLDPADYTHAAPKNSSTIIVELESSSTSAQWVLGAPFLRKFPARFSTISQDVVLYCTAGVSCRPQSFGTLSRAFLPDQTPGWTVQSTSSDGDRSRNTSRNPYTPSPTQYRIVSYQEPSSFLVGAIWLGRSLAVLILLVVLIQTVASCRSRLHGRRRGQAQNVPDETGTVASERDIEETKEELRAMAAAEEGQRQRRGARPIIDESATEFVLVQSPLPNDVHGYSLQGETRR